MPFFLDMPIYQPMVAPIPTISTSQPLAIAPISSTSSNGMDKIKLMIHSMMQNMDKINDHSFDMDKESRIKNKVMQKMNNGFVSLKIQ